MLQGQPELMTRLWRSHHDLKATCRGLSYRSAQKVLDSIKFFFERVSHNYIIVLLNFYYCLILVEILIFFLINIYHPVLRAIYRTSWYTHSVVFGVWFREGLKKYSGKFHLGGGGHWRPIFTKKKTQKNMGLKHWIWHNNHFKTHLFFLIFGRGDPFQLRSWSEGWLKQVSAVPYHTEFV